MLEDKLNEIIQQIGWGNIQLEIVIKNGQATVVKVIRTEQTVIVDNSI